MASGVGEHGAALEAGERSGGGAMSDASPEWLAARARDGGEGSVRCFGELIRRYESRVFTFVSRRVSPSDAEDVTQEAFLRAWRSLGRYDETRRFSAWLFTIAARAASDHRRGSGRRKFREAVRARRDIAAAGEVPGGGGSGAVDPSDRARGAALWRLAEVELTEDAYSALWLRYAEGLAPAEIAKALGRSSVWVRVSLFRSRATLEQRAHEQGVLFGSVGRVRESGQIVGGAS